MFDQVEADEPPDMPEQARRMQTFSVAVNVAASTSIDFSLSYMELIKRTLGVYEHIISVRPNQLVDDLCIIASLYEPQGMDQIKLPSVLSKHSFNNCPHSSCCYMFFHK